MVPGQLENILISISFINQQIDSEKKIQYWRDFFKQQNYVVVSAEDPRPHYQFQIGEHIQLTDLQNRKLQLDFANNHLDYKRNHRGKSELIAKALGIQKTGMTVLDLSFGLGIDAIFLSQLGCKVTAVERHPLLFALIQESLWQANIPIDVRFGDSSEYLQELLEQEICDLFDVIYFDPMYPEKKKSALPRKEMVFFRDLVGFDLDADLVLEKALLIPNQRIVVKRPLKAPSLNGQVIHQFIGKTVRYDLYKGKIC